MDKCYVSLGGTADAHAAATCRNAHFFHLPSLVEEEEAIQLLSESKLAIIEPKHIPDLEGQSHSSFKSL